jgi:ribosomal RNA-processing protein 12
VVLVPPSFGCSRGSDSQTLDATAVAALLSFLSIVVPLVPPQGIAAPKASEAVGVLVGLVGKEREGLAVARNLKQVN